MQEKFDKFFREIPKDYDCPFCDVSELAEVLAETDSFRLVADIAPLVEGHILIIPKGHFPCYGAMPLVLEPEVEDLKKLSRKFLTACYHEPIFWEHGVFRQTVYHAHLHCMPIGQTESTLHLEHGFPCRGMRGLADWYDQYNGYFYFEQDGSGYVFPAEEERYFKVLDIVRDGVAKQGKWHPTEIRRKLGQKKIKQLLEKWGKFQDL